MEGAAAGRGVVMPHSYRAAPKMARPAVGNDWSTHYTEQARFVRPTPSPALPGRGAAAKSSPRPAIRNMLAGMLHGVSRTTTNSAAVNPPFSKPSWNMHMRYTVNITDIEAALISLGWRPTITLIAQRRLS